MMNKNFISKTSPKWLLWSIITAIIVLAGIIVMAIAGVNDSKTTMSGNLVVVNVTMESDRYEDEIANIQTVCEKTFEEAGVEPVYSYTGEISLQSHEIVYVFDIMDKVDGVKDTLQDKFDAMPEYERNFIKTSEFTQSVRDKLPGGYAKFLWRNVLAGVVIAAAAFLYVTLRYKLSHAITTFVTAGASAAITCGLIVATRVVITPSVMYAVLFSMLVSVVFSVLFAAKNRKAEKEQGAITDAEKLAETVPVCDVMKLSVALGVVILALAIVGICMAENFAWFALIVAFALLAAVYGALLLGPSVYLAIHKKLAAFEAKRARYDYKKGGKSKKAEKKEAPAADAAAEENAAE